MPQTPTPHPWDQQPNESDKAYEYFRTYRDIGLTRTLTETGKQHDKTRMWMSELSAKHNWIERAQAWDKHVEQQWAKEVQEQRRKAAKKHVAIANDMLEKAAEKLSTLDLFEMKPSDVSKWVEVAVKITRAAYGEPENITITGPQGGPIQLEDLTKMSLEERRQRLLSLQADINRRVTTNE